MRENGIRQCKGITEQSDRTQANTNLGEFSPPKTYIKSSGEQQEWTGNCCNGKDRAREMGGGGKQLRCRPSHYHA